MRKTVLSLLIATCLSAGAQQRVSLAGKWLLKYGQETTIVTLPGTMDTNHKGIPITQKDETTHLSRRYSYKGKAWYEKEILIPRSWRHKSLTVFLERTKPTWLYVDGVLVDSCNNISTPQRYQLNPLRPGLHTLRILVDNSSGVPEQLYASSHAYTEDTQTNWNGIIGLMYIECSGGIGRANGTNKTNGADGTTKINGARNPSLIIRNRHFYDAEGHRVFLRGKHDACVWPLTGHCPMDQMAWHEYFRTCQDYGINHVRFHSWCPPEAAFAAADELGIYLQPELPFWGDFNAKDSVLMQFLHKEGVNIMREYSHHPSFAMFALGNELWGSIDEMSRFVDDFRLLAPHVLFTFGSNYYLGYQGVKPGMDYFTTCRVGGEAWGSYDTHTRGSFSFADAYDGGMINHLRPNAKMNFEEGCSRSSVPVISHETAQFQIYPDYNEIRKYTGVLRPCNMEVFRQRLADAGMADQAEAFHRASGRWAYLLYKQDIEMDLRTPNMAGFQLLDLQDYPGQGSAYVGILDAFMDSKGICTQSEWRQFCSPVVPLLVSDAYCFTFSEGIHGKIQIANYSGGSLSDTKVRWECAGQQGELRIPDGEGLLDAGAIDIDLKHLKQATHLRLTLHIGDYHNSYDLWAYPDDVKLDKKGIVMTSHLTADIVSRLQKGAKVLLTPDSTEQCVGGLFQTDYWNYRMFKTISENNKKTVSPGTLGLLCDPKHPLFCDFPTDEHTSWQWFPVVKASHPFILDHTSKDYRPIVQVIDNIERNHKLGLVFEFQVGKGRLLIVMSNLEQAARYPEGRQFYASVLNYMHSKDFAPATAITADQLHKLFTTKVNEKQMEELNNISPY